MMGADTHNAFFHWRAGICVIIACLINGVTSLAREEIRFIVEPSDEIAVVGRPVTLHCQLLVVDSNPEFVKVAIRWRGDDHSSFFDHRDPQRTVLSNGSLHIPRVSEADQGNYQCVASVDPIGAAASRIARLKVIHQISIEKHSQDLRVNLGQTAHFICRIVGTLPHETVWLKDDRVLEPESGRITIMPSGSLEIDLIEADDAGSYRCNVSSSSLFKLGNKAVLTVNPDSPSHNTAPIFITKPRSATVGEGQSVTLDCAANGNPRPWLIWLKDGVAINMSDTRFVKYGTGSLQIANVGEKDVGNYQCRAGNQEDSVDASAILQVQVPPRFVKKPLDVVSTEKEDLELPCQVYGRPEPKVQWAKNGEIITMNDYMQLNGGYNLKIGGLMAMDSGIFQCMASNAAGFAQTAARVTIRSAGDLDDDTSDYDLPSIMDFEKRVRGRKTPRDDEPPIREYFFDEGSEEETAAMFSPSAPSNLRPEIVANRFVTLSWDPPVETHGRIIAYSVFYRLEGSPRERIVNTSKEIGVTVQGLQPDRVYHFRVVAYNDAGPGESSEDVEISTGTEAHVPNSPLDMTVTATSPTSLKIDWKPPSAPSGDVLEYRLFYMEEDSPEESHISTTKTSYELTGLQKFTDYAIWVVAANSNGPGSPSEEVTVRTLSDVPSEPPMNVTAEPASSTSIIVRWEPPPKDSQNGVITGYKLRYKKQKGKGLVETTAGDRRLYAISDLEKGALYQVRVAAMTVNGSGPASEWQTVETYDNDLDETQVPGIPSNLMASRASSNSIRVSWNAPSESNIMVRGYTIGWGKGIPDDYTKVIEGKQRFYNIEDLHVNSEYVIAVRAFNEMGDGAPSYVSVWTRDEPALETASPLIPPVGLKAIVLSSSTVVLYWTDTLSSKSMIGSDDRYYTVQYTSPHHSSAKPKYLNVTELNCMITDLRPNTLYEFSVKFTKGRRDSKWSMVVQNTTQEAPPASPPRDLTVVPVDNQLDQIILNWQPPKQSNGLITGYMVLYTTDENLVESEWVPKDISGDMMTAVLRGLQPSTTYYLKIQAKNSKGYGPVSSKVVFTTPASPLSFDANLTGKDGKLVSNMVMYVVGCSVIGALCVALIVGVVCCKRAKSRRRRNDTYLKNNLKDKTSVKPPDLWIHHDQMELKNMEKSHHSNSDIGPSGSQMNTLVRATSSHPSEFDHSGSIDQRTYLPSYVGDDYPTGKTSTIKRSSKPKPISIPMDSSPVSQPIASTMPSPGCEGPRQMYSRTQYRSHLIDSSSAENPYSLQGGYDSIGSMQQHGVQPTSNYPNMGACMQPCAAVTATPCQPEGGTLTKRQHTHPLKSFTVPAPPPQSAPGTPQQKHVVRPTQCSSPYKKPAHSIACSGSPNNTKLRNGPGTAEETTRLQPSYSSEELTQEMANLEGLMKDLDAITASEFEC